jgi:hypothetical protein
MLGRMTALDVISQHFGSFADSSSIFILLLLYRVRGEPKAAFQKLEFSA